jgi:creatinine amidohydrolase
MPTYLERLTWQNFRRLVPRTYPVAIIPIGTVEAHGVCAIGTDNLIPADLAAEIADELKAVICPPIPYGLVKGLAGYPGSIPVSDATFTAYVTEVLTELARRGFERIIVLNGHGGNTSALKNAAYAAHDLTRKKYIVLDWWYLAEDVCREVYGQAGGHAGCDENGYILALDPAMVKPEDYSDDLVFLVSPAVAPYPYPGPVLIYKDGEGAPDFDREKAVRYRRGAIDKVREYLLMVLDRWNKIEAVE